MYNVCCKYNAIANLSPYHALCMVVDWTVVHNKDQDHQSELLKNPQPLHSRKGKGRVVPSHILALQIIVLPFFVHQLLFAVLHFQQCQLNCLSKWPFPAMLINLSKDPPR